MSNLKSKMSFKKIKNSTNILHNDTGLVLTSVKDKIVIGRLENESIIPLDKICVELCKKWNLKYDDKLFKDIKEDGEEDEENGEEDEEGDEEDGEEDEEGDEEKEEGEGDEEKEEGEEDGEEEKEEGDEEKGDDEKDEGDEEKGELKGGKETIYNMEKENTISTIDFKNIDPVKTVYLRDLTTEFSEDLFKFFDNLNLKYLSKITELENSIMVNNVTIKKLDDDLNNEKVNHNKTSNDLIQLQNKFNNIKNLFS